MIDPNRLCLGCMNEMAEGETLCRNCGWENAKGSNEQHQLCPGTVLQGKYLVGKVLGEGGFGITYIGWNIFREEKVAIKEFYPQELMVRDMENHTTVHTFAGKEKVVQKGKDVFIREAKTMAGLSKIEGIVDMKDVFTENQTVYIVMDLIEGKNLKQYARENGGRLPINKALELLKPVMDALEHVHAHGLIHRDISPDNIMITPDGKAVLLDFGAAREISAEGERSLTVNLKHGYAPIEQYQTHGAQGPWTDVYALCATIYRLITGKTLPNAADRIIRDEMIKPSVLCQDITLDQEAILYKGLSVRREIRYQNISELKAAFYGNAPAPAMPSNEEKTGFNMPMGGGFQSGEQTGFAGTEFSPKKTAINKKIIAAVAGGIAVVIIAILLMINPMRYNSAVKYMENERYEEAIEIFTALGSYNDSEELAENCSLLMKEKDYNYACELLGDGNYEEAKAVFETLEGYAESEANLLICEKGISYNSAMELMEAGKYEEAVSILTSIGDFIDCKDKKYDCFAEIYGSDFAQMVMDIENAEIGETVTIGTYEQDNSFSNGAEPIEWIVFDKQEGKTLLLSRYVLDTYRMNRESADSWKESGLRTWLNGEFLNTAFSADEQKIIPLTKNDNSANNKLNAEYIEDISSEDRIFLISVSSDEAFDLFNIATSEATKYAKSQGAEAAEKGYWFWTRTYSYYNNNFCAVSTYQKGYYMSYGNGRYGIRPVMWVDTSLLG